MTKEISLKRKRAICLMPIAFILFWSCNCFAITYTESISGDLMYTGTEDSERATYTDVGTLDLGVNLVSGHFLYDSAPPERYDYE